MVAQHGQTRLVIRPAQTGEPPNQIAALTRPLGVDVSRADMSIALFELFLWRALSFALALLFLPTKQWLEILGVTEELEMKAARSEAQRRGFAGGCLTCRMRKVKCDEQKPCCQRCVSTGRTCDGYTALPFTRSDLQAAAKRARYTRGAPSTALVSTLLSDVAFGDTLERRYFQFFRCSTLASTALTVDSNFWNRTVLQAFHSEPAIRHAVLSIGAIHNYMMDSGNSESSIAQKHLLYAEKNYVLGLGETRKLIGGASTSRMNRILIACVLFILWEGLRGNYAASKSHMESGRALLKRFWFQTKGQTNTQNHLSDILQVFTRVDISAITFSDASAPYSYSLPDLFAIGANFQLEPFENLQQASSVLMELVRWMLMLGNEVLVEFESGHSNSAPDLATAMVNCKHHIEAWGMHWNEWTSRNSHASESLSALNAKLWYTTAKLMLDAEFAGAECRYDAHEQGFSRVVDLAELLSTAIANEPEISTSFSLDLGYIVPTFYSATRCRNPVIRRRAVEVLHLQPRHEGAWQSVPAAVICERWINVEEEGLSFPFPASQVTEKRRVSTMDVEVLQQQRLAKLRFHLAGTGNSSVPTSIREQAVNWG